MNRNTACVVWPVKDQKTPEAHVTILYLGEVLDKPNVFAQVVECLNAVQIPAIGEVKVGGLEVFGTPDNLVLVATLRDDYEEMARWNERLLSALSLYKIKNGSAFKNYTPHVTVGKTIPASLPESYTLGSPELWWGDYRLRLSDFGLSVEPYQEEMENTFPDAPEGVDVASEIAAHAKTPTVSVTALSQSKPKWDIWAEGYAATGDSGGARCLGQGYGDTFNEAVQNHVDSLGDANAAFYTLGSAGIWRYWGCRLFDNRHDAQRSFG